MSPICPACLQPAFVPPTQMPLKTASSPAFLPLMDYFPRRPFLLLSPVLLLRSSLSSSYFSILSLL